MNNLLSCKIFISDEGKSVPILDAMKLMTDEWFDNGQSCTQTEMDMRDALRVALLKK